jgi:hypothetical protein
MRSFIVCIVIFSSLFLMSSCGNKKSKLIDADVINNPISAEPSSEKNHQPVFQFDRTEHDFGKLVDGEKVTFSFRFVNVGASDLVIIQAKGSCGCTVPRFPTNPIKPNEVGLIEVTFDSSNRLGFQNKTITVVANTIPSTVVLTIKANVVKL